jgi:translation initiation factor IF-3
MVRAIIPSTYSSSTRSSEDSSNGEGSPGGGKEKGESKSELMKTKDALNLAKSLGLDLVLVASKTDPPVARIVEWNKLAFEMNKKLKEKEKSQRESQKKAEPKEIRLSHNIAQHDLSMKLAQARKFLQGGSHLKLQVESKRFENIPQGRVTLLKAIDELKDDCFLRNPDQVMRPYGRHWQVQLAPLGAENKASSNITEELLSSKFKPPPPPQPTSSSSLHFRSSR